MPTIVETLVFALSELSDRAKDEARCWYRREVDHDDWFDAVFDDFEEICRILGLSIGTRSVPLMGGGFGTRSCIYFSGFFSQGDGACFTGSYGYEKGSARAIRSCAPRDAELHRIADELVEIQQRNFFQLRAEISHHGRYYHEFSMDIRVERDSPTYQVMTADAEDIVIDAMRDLARWLYHQLEQEWEYLNSDEVVDEAIIANAFTFTEDGQRFGNTVFDHPNSSPNQPDGFAPSGR